MKQFWLNFILLVLLGACLATQLFAGGEEVIVIYNSRVPESKEVADYYALKRNVPTNQMFGFNLPTGSDITRDQFKHDLQKPLASELESRNLWHIRSQTFPATNGHPSGIQWRVQDTRIRYAVLCYGVPFRILEDNSSKGTNSGNARSGLGGNEACVENELALLPLVQQSLPIAGPANNRNYGATTTTALSPTNGILMVARLDGPSALIARRLVDKAMEAETNGMWGRAYFDTRGLASGSGLKIGDDWINGAAEISRKLGFETIVDTNGATFPASFPMSQIAIYCGWYDEHFSGPFTQPLVEFMPGAFAYHLHSFNAADIRNPSNRWVGPFLAEGVTITMGSVNEPYLSGTPNVAIFCSDLIYGGYSFGEAAYASQPWLSWQTTVIGDPLYRPFGVSPEKVHAALEACHSPLIGWSYLRLVNISQASLKRPLNSLVQLVEQIPVLNESAVLMEKLGDLYEAQGKPGSAIASYEKAMNLNPSPQQRIRLRLTLGEKLVVADKRSEAADDYEKLLQEFPDYPGTNFVWRQIANLKPLVAATNSPAKN